jgi:predicted alpha/beta superfamily hydrolase
LPTPSDSATPPAKPQQEEASFKIFGAGVETHDLSRRVIECSDGRRYQLFFALPRRRVGGATVPLLYMLDGNAAFDALTPEFLASVTGLAIVGVGYAASRSG